MAMYSSSSSSCADNSLGYDAALPFPLLPLPQLTISEQLTELEPQLKPLSYPDVSYSGSSCCSSGGNSCYDSPSYGPDQTTRLNFQRSISSHTLQRPHGPFPSWTIEFFDSETGPVRRVYITGDLEGVNGVQSYKRSESPPLRSESSMIIEGMNRACKYSPEEKKERIERYRSKRNQRNFNKKIKYACRKTLADSRPRIRGRFARNDEIDQKSFQLHEWSMETGGEEDEDEDDNWANFLDAFSSAGNLIP